MKCARVARGGNQTSVVRQPSLEPLASGRICWERHRRFRGGLVGPLQQTIKAVIRPGDQAGYVAECLELAVVTQGRTLDETDKNLQEATALHFEGESPASFGLCKRTIV